MAAARGIYKRAVTAENVRAYIVARTRRACGERLIKRRQSKASWYGVINAANIAKLLYIVLMTRADVRRRHESVARRRVAERKWRAAKSVRARR